MVTFSPSRLFFLAVLLLVVAERIFELVLSARNARRTLARGGVVSGERYHWAVVVLHVVWLVAVPLEVFVLQRPWIPWLGISMTLVLAASMVLRYWSVVALGDRWNVRIIVLAGEEPVTSGPFRWFRHPSYVAALSEFVTVPLIHTAWLTPLLFGPLNAVALVLKIKAEERALMAMPEYRGFAERRRRFVPGGR